MGKPKLTQYRFYPKIPIITKAPSLSLLYSIPSLNHIGSKDNFKQIQKFREPISHFVGEKLPENVNVFSETNISHPIPNTKIGNLLRKTMLPTKNFTYKVRKERVFFYFKWIKTCIMALPYPFSLSRVFHFMIRLRASNRFPSSCFIPFVDNPPVEKDWYQFYKIHYQQRLQNPAELEGSESLAQHNRLSKNTHFTW